MAAAVTMKLTRARLVLLPGLGFGGTFTVSGDQSRAAPPPALVRGNVPGEWRYWGGDAWSTRYSPLDQINASNFGKLKIAWQWNAGAFGQDEYYRTTPLYANGRLFTVATTRRIAAALDPENGETLWMWRMDEGIRWQKAPRQFAGRGPAYWTDGTSERVDRDHAWLPPGIARREDGPARSEVRQERDRRSHGWARIPARAACRG